METDIKIRFVNGDIVHVKEDYFTKNFLIGTIVDCKIVNKILCYTLKVEIDSPYDKDSKYYFLLRNMPHEILNFCDVSHTVLDLEVVFFKCIFVKSWLALQKLSYPITSSEAYLPLVKEVLAMYARRYNL